MTVTESNAARLVRMRREIAALEYQIQRCNAEDRLRLNRQLQHRKDGLCMVLKLKG